MDLAGWLVDPQHPLTARVAVNRFWQQIFGVGLVKTTEDFGAQGEIPVQMDLINWLAKLLKESVTAGQLQAVLDALLTGRDEAEGLQVPSSHISWRGMARSQPPWTRMPSS